MQYIKVWHSRYEHLNPPHRSTVSPLCIPFNNFSYLLLNGTEKSQQVSCRVQVCRLFFFVAAMNDLPCYRTPRAPSPQPPAVDSDSDFPSEILSSKYAFISCPVIFINITICTERRPSPVPLRQVHLIFPSLMQ